MFKCVPIAPLHYVKGADGEWRKVFTSDALEARDVLPHYDILRISARAYPYTEEDFSSVEEAIRRFVDVGSVGDYDFSPHHLWHYAIVNKPVGSAQTYFERAIATYAAFIEQERRRRKEELPKTPL